MGSSNHLPLFASSLSCLTPCVSCALCRVVVVCASAGQALRRLKSVEEAEREGLLKLSVEKVVPSHAERSQAKEEAEEVTKDGARQANLQAKSDADARSEAKGGDAALRADEGSKVEAKAEAKAPSRAAAAAAKLSGRLSGNHQAQLGRVPPQTPTTNKATTASQAGHAASFASDQSDDTNLSVTSSSMRCLCSFDV